MAKGNSTKPGTPAPAAKKEKVVKVSYPGLNPDAEGKPTTKLESWPTDFDPKTQKPLKRSDFASDAPFLEKRAIDLETKAAQLRKEADDARKLGSSADRAKAKKLRDMVGKMAELSKMLKGQGIDVDSILGELTKSDTPAA